MRSLRRAAARLRDAGSIPLLAALLLIAAGAPLAADAGERGRPNDSSDVGRSAQPRESGGQAPSSPPSYSPPPSSTPPSSGGSEPRVAVPRTGGGNDGPSRQRPHNPSGSGRDWHGGGGGWYGGYSWPRYYYYGPYWGWGWGWGSWWWDDYYWYGSPYGHYGRYGRYGYGDRYGYDRYGSAGALDVDVSPGKTEVWIDGRYTGTADDFDGFPQYLWLDAGTYDVVLYREGYKTIARQVTIRPGQVISMGDRLQPGESVRPEDLATKTHDRRDERIRSEEERRDEIARRDRDDGMDDWRDRARRRMEERNRYEDDDEAEDDASGVGRLRLDIEPSDASVYLDGRFVGTGLDLQRSRNGLRLDPGQHRIAVVRPGHKAAEQEFTVAAGEEVELEFDLESVE